MAVGTLTGNDYLARLATFQGGFSGIELETAFRSATAMAFNAAGVEDRLDLLLKIDVVIRRRGQLLSLFRGKSSHGTDAAKQKTEDEQLVDPVHN
jgi:hypothetical protein